jgi:4'-phosphopantetheinyl transferase
VTALPLHWPVPRAHPPLDREEVHVWSAPLARPAEEIDRLLGRLSPEEQVRARRYKVAPAREQFVVARWLLRSLLARYLGMSPGEVPLTQGVQGKPALEGVPGLHFNASHSHGLALYAVTARGAVGVDVERVRSFTNDLALAERYFCPAEIEALRGLAGEARSEVFFHIWTRKEAFVKALGLGLGYGVDRVEVSTDPSRAELLRLPEAEGGESRWSMEVLMPAPGYVGAVCLEGTGEVRCWGWGVDQP